MLNQFWQVMSLLGDLPFWAAVALAILAASFILGKKKMKNYEWISNLLLPSVAISAILSYGLKLTLHTERICSGLSYCPVDFGFPSMHSAAVMAFFMVVLLQFRGKPDKNFLIITASMIFSFIIAYSRIALGVHSLDEVVAGSLLGIAVASSWFLFHDMIFSSRDHFYLRKLIHLSGLVFFLGYFWVPKEYLIGLLLLLAGFYLASEVARSRKIYFPVIQEMTLYCSKKNESNGVVISPILFCLSLAFLMMLPEKSFIIGSIVLIIGDFFAGFLGYRFGNTKLPFSNGKSFEGSIALFTSSFLFLMVFFNPVTALSFSFIGAVVESFFVRYENFLLPVIVGILAMLI